MVEKKQLLVTETSKVLQKKWVVDMEKRRSVQIHRSRASAASLWDTQPMRTKVPSDDSRSGDQDTQWEPGSKVLGG